MKATQPKMKTASTLAFAVLLSLAAQAQLAPQAEAPLYRHMLEVNAQWQHMDPALAQATEPVHFSNEAARIAKHLHLVAAFLRTHPAPNSAPSALAQRNTLLNYLDAYADRGIFPKNYVLPYRNPVFIDPGGTACAVGQLMIESGHRDLAESIDHEQELAYVAELLDSPTLGPPIAAWAEEHGFTGDELAWIQPGYPPATEWNALGGGTDGPVKVLLNLPGSSIVVAGAFTSAGGVAVQNVALWNGTGFQPLGSGVSGTIVCGAVKGNDIYLGGYNLNGINDLARWDGTQWSFSTVFDGKFPQVFALHVLDDVLYAAGETQGFAGPDEYVMGLSGDTWTPLPGHFNAPVRCLGERNGQLVAGGGFTAMVGGGLIVQHVAFFGTSGWEQLGNGLEGPVNALANTADGTLFAGGAMYNGTTPLFGLARIGMGPTWELLLPNLANYIGTPSSPDLAEVRTLAADGAGVWAGGSFTVSQGTLIGNHLAYCNGVPDAFEPGAFFNEPVNALVPAFGGTGVQDLVAGGDFTNGSSGPAPYLAVATIGTGVHSSAPAAGFVLSPNPAQNELRILLEQAPGAGAHLEVLDAQGRTVLRNPVADRSATLDIQSLAAGRYSVVLHNGSGAAPVAFIKH